MPTYPSAFTCCGYSEHCDTDPIDGANAASSRANARRAGWHAPGPDEPADYEDRCPAHIGMPSIEDYSYSVPWLPRFLRYRWL